MHTYLILFWTVHLILFFWQANKGDALVEGFVMMTYDFIFGLLILIEVLPGITLKLIFVLTFIGAYSLLKSGDYYLENIVHVTSVIIGTGLIFIFA